MKYAYAGFGMVFLGLFAFVIVMIFQFITINNESDYYSLKEAMEASMYEAIDWDYYTGVNNNGAGEIKIIKEKFVANFTRRFAKNTIGNSNGYVIEFYDIMEKPPKASVIIKNKTSSMALDTEDFTIVNELTGILEAKKIPETTYNGGCENGKNIVYNTINREYYSNLPINNSTEYMLNTNTIKSKIEDSGLVNSINDIKSLSIESFKFIGFVNSFNENQSDSYFAYRKASGWEQVTNTNSNFLLKDGCRSEFVSFGASVSDGRHSKIGNESSKPTQVGDPVIIKVEIGNSYEINKGCSFASKYTITWRYGYCK